MCSVWVHRVWAVSAWGQKQPLRHEELQQELLVCAVALKPPEALVTQMDLEVWNSELKGQCRSSAVLSCMKMCLRYIAASPEQQ